MSIFTRVERLVKASIHEGLERMEEPLALLKQEIRDTKQSIAKKKEQVTKQENMFQTFERAIETAGKLADKRQQQAEIAIEKQEEDFAKRALIDKRQALNEQQKFQALIEQNKQSILDLKAEIQELEHSLKVKAEQKRELEQQKEADKAGAELKKMFAQTSHFGANDSKELDQWSKAALEIENDNLKAEIEAELAQLKAAKQG
ncbi:PspA/IM30 family protein [Alkalihalobacillus sp. FSL W8-0930]